MGPPGRDGRGKEGREKKGRVGKLGRDTPFLETDSRLW